jgi:hypothetical protein
VEIPPGLEQRLVAVLAVGQADASLSTSPPDAARAAIVAPSPFSGSTLPRPSAQLPGIRKHLPRRWFYAAGGTLAAAALLAAVFFGLSTARGVSQQTALDEALRCFDADASAAPGRLLAEHPAAPLAPSKNLLPLKGVRWRTVADFLGRSGAAFDLPPQGCARATLYAVRCPLAGAAASPPLDPFTTGGYCRAAWVENGTLYVLVVQGSRQAYQSYLNLPRGPLA